MMTGRHISVVLAILAGSSVAGCSNLPDPDYQGKTHDEGENGLTRPEILAGVLTRVAGNAEKAGDYQAAELFYRRAHNLGSRKIETTLGLARSLLALNEPLAASEAYGAALAIDEHNEEAVAGLAKSLELVAANSAKNRPADIPPPPAVAAAAPSEAPDADGPTGEGIAATPEPATGDGSPSMAPTEAMTAEEKNGEVASVGADPTGTASPDRPAETSSPMAGEAAAPGPGAAAESPAAGSPAAESTGAFGAKRGQKVKLNEVLSAIEWKADKAGAAPGAIAPPIEPEGIQAANSRPGSMPLTRTTDTAAPPAPAPAATPSGYRLQLGAFSAAAGAAAARARINAKARNVLNGVELRVETVDRGAGRPPVYKLRSDPVGARNRAADLCARLKAQSIGCFLVKPLRAAAKPSNPVGRTAAAPARPDPSPMTTASQEAPQPSAPAQPGAPGKKDGAIGWEMIKDLNDGAGTTDGAGSTGPTANGR